MNAQPSVSLPRGLTPLTLVTKSQSTPVASIHTNTIKSLYRLGWNLTNIANAIHQDGPAQKTHAYYLTKWVIASDPTLKVLSFADLLQLLPIDALVEPPSLLQYTEFLQSLLDPSRPKQKTTPFGIHTINILALIGWKKTRIAKLFKVTPAMISIYTNGLAPWSVDELREIMPRAFTCDEVSLANQTRIPS